MMGDPKSSTGTESRAIKTKAICIVFWNSSKKKLVLPHVGSVGVIFAGPYCNSIMLMNVRRMEGAQSDW